MDNIQGLQLLNAYIDISQYLCKRRHPFEPEERHRCKHCCIPMQALHAYENRRLVYHPMTIHIPAQIDSYLWWLIHNQPLMVQNCRKCYIFPDIVWKKRQIHFRYDIVHRLRQLWKLQKASNEIRDVYTTSCCPVDNDQLKPIDTLKVEAELRLFDVDLIC